MKKWAYSINQKLKIALWSSVILGIILAKNWIDKNNVAELGSSFASVYEDRLLVESYIFELSEHLYEKKIMFSSCDNETQFKSLLAQLPAHNATIARLIHDFERTKLTHTESAYLVHFKENMNDLVTLEQSFVEQFRKEGYTAVATTLGNLDNHFQVAFSDLNQLSKIQIAEGKLLKDQSKKIIAGSVMLTQFELAVVIVAALAIQVIIFASRSAFPKSPQKYQLN